MRAGFSTAEIEIVIDQQRCTGCGLCVKICPAHFIVVPFENRKVARVVNGTACQLCFNCERTCPRKAIYHRSLREESRV